MADIEQLIEKMTEAVDRVEQAASQCSDKSAKECVDVVAKHLRHFTSLELRGISQCKRDIFYADENLSRDMLRQPTRRDERHFALLHSSRRLLMSLDDALQFALLSRSPNDDSCVSPEAFYNAALHSAGFAIQQAEAAMMDAVR